MPSARHGTSFILVVGLLLTLALGTFGCGAEPSGTTDSALTSTVTAVRDTTTATVPEASTTTEPTMSMTTSAVVSAMMHEAKLAAERLGAAVVAYINGQGDLAAVESLLAPAAQDGLTQLLGALVEPVGCKVTGTGNYGGSSEVEVGLLFADGKSRYEPGSGLTVVVEQGNATITGISAPTLRTPGSNSSLFYLNPTYPYYTCAAVVLGRVVEVLPLRRNPLAGTGTSTSKDGPQPVAYKGYVLEVEKAWGPGSMPQRITAYALANGTVEVGGVTEEVHVDLPLEARADDRLLLPLLKAALFGTPELQPDEYWVQANQAVFVVDDGGRCMRAVGADLDPESRSEFSLSDLESIVVEQGKEPSAIE